jgi:FkbM family methyltransferase
MTTSLAPPTSPGFFRRIPGIRRFCDIAASVPGYVKSRKKWIARQFLCRWYLWPCTIHHTSGAQFRLRKDYIADQILSDLHGLYASLFYPPDFQNPPDDALILDIGAHHGGYAITTLFRFPNLRVISIEPDPQSLRALRENLALNHLSEKVEIHPCGIGPAHASALLEQSTDGSWGNRVVSQPASCPTVPIQLHTLDEILRGRQPYLVKCNCEGGEFHAIPQLFALNCRPQFIILMVHPAEGDADALLAQVTSAGYTITPVESSLDHPRYVCRLSPNNAHA